TYTPVPIAGWGVIVQRSGQLAFASLDSLQRGMALALVLFGLGAILFWIILSQRLINPLEKLTHYGERVGAGASQVELEQESIVPISERPDQIGRLTRTLLLAEQHIRLRLMELTTLNKTSAAVVSTLDTQQVIDTILDEVQRLLSVRQCSLLILDESAQQLQVRASRGLSQAYPPTIDITGIWEQLPACRAIKTNRPVQAPDVEADPNFAPLLSLARSEGYRSLLVVPLNAPHIPGAALSIYRPDPHQFTEQEIDLVASFANYAAIALEHATLFSLTDAELQKQVRFLSALNRVAHTVSQSLLIDDVLGNAMDAVFEVMPAGACWIYLQRETENFLRLRAQHGFPPEFLEWVRDQQVEHGQGVIGYVAQSGQSLLLAGPNLTAEAWSTDPMIMAGYWQSLAAAPLRAKEVTIGVLGIAAGPDQAFTSAEVELLGAIGNQIAIAVLNARLYRRSRDAAILEERNRVAREIHDTLAQGFTGILVQLQAVERLSLKHPEKALQSLQEARELARQSLHEARRSVLNLRPKVLDLHTLDRVIAQEVRRFEHESGVKADFILQGYPVPLNPEVEQNLYRITQESLTNVKRHAQAAHVTVSLTFEPKTVVLTITDDGIGFSRRRSANGPINRPAGSNFSGDGGGFGLVGIQERVNLMQGNMVIETPSIGGTCIKVEIPK
ncbi:MAG: GAF domain-containing sensor histidine kinase, partial [Chloroflexota bacterium]